MNPLTDERESLMHEAEENAILKAGDLDAELMYRLSHRVHATIAASLRERIADLEAENERLCRVLQPFADMWNMPVAGVLPPVEWYHRAADALERNRNQPKELE